MIYPRSNSYATGYLGSASFAPQGAFGLGDIFNATANLATIASTGGSTAVTGAGSAIGTGAGAATGLATAGIGAGLALAAQGISMWVQSARLRGGQKLQATNVANEVERKLKDLKAAYNASTKTHAEWVVAKGVENNLFDLLQHGCGTMELGSAGQRCVEERMCFEGEGCKYPWRSWYSIGPEPPPDPKGSDEITSAVSGALAPIAQKLGVSPTMLMLGAGLIVVGLIMSASGGNR